MYTILIVDDEFGIAESVASLFSDEGYRAFTSVNGRQGLDKMAEIKADIVLIDYMMPVMNGGEMLQALRAQPSYAALPIVLMSGVAEALVQQDPLAKGYDAFVRKPFDAATILKVVRRLLRIGP
jgi:CheY-like chemotaxis protein